MKEFFKRLTWYPPAETRIPASAILSAIISEEHDFKKVLCNYLGVKQCVLGNSGRALLYLLLKTLKRKGSGIRDEVLIPGYTCYSVAASVAKAGLKIRVYDLNPRTLAPDTNSFKKGASGKTLAIIYQHLFGIPTAVHDLKKTAMDTGAYLIEDSAQALGCAVTGRPLGSMGDFGFYSFGRGKPLPVGCGGALIGRDEDTLSELDLKSRDKGYASLMALAVSQILSKPSLYWLPEMLPLGLGETIFEPDFDVSNMPLLAQKLADKSMSVLDDLNTHRRHITNVYNKSFDHEYLIPFPDGATPVNTRLPLMAGPKPVPKELKRLGVRRMYPKSITDEETIKPYLAKQQVPTFGASKIAQNLITLPTHLGISENLAKEIAQGVKAAYFKPVGG